MCMIDDIIRRVIREATTTSTNGRGSYIAPLTNGIRVFKDVDNQPFTIQVSKYDSPFLEYDSYDGSMSTPKKQIKKIEKQAEKITNYITNHPYATFSDDDGNVINQTPGKGKKFVPINENDEISEDLGVWFGTKKKPKGSKQPKGPWVNICRKVDGKHPPCGRSETDSGGYPKCRAAGVAGKMSDSEKKSACQQKRSAEKKDTQTGKGQKPIMTSYKKKKTNENMKRIVRLTENDLSRIVKRILSESGDKGNMREYKPKLPKRPMASDDTSLQNEMYPNVSYGYDKIYGKSVVASGNRRFGTVFYYCDMEHPKNVEFDFKMSNSGYGNPYDKHNINIDTQKTLDSNWLSSICDSIRWKPKKD